MSVVVKQTNRTKELTMNARILITGLSLLSLTTLAMGCEEPQFIEVTKTEYVEVDDVDYLDSCDWRSIEGCGDPGFQCDRDWHNPDGDGICTFAQGAECEKRDAESPIGADRCGRGLRCQPDTRAERGVYLCLPNTCIHNDECSEGHTCANNVCYAPGPGCATK
jgi:hypothetical protein